MDNNYDIMGGKHKLLYLIVFVIALVVFTITLVCPWLYDELFYMFSFSTNKPIGSLGDVVESNNAHYFVQNGRYVAHVLVQFFVCLTNRYVFTVCNALIYVLFILGVIKVSKIKNTDDCLMLIAALVCFCGFQTKFIPTYQINYHWMMAINLLVLYLFFNKANLSGIWLLLSAFVSLIAGEWHEALSVGICCSFFIYAIQHRHSLTLMQRCMIASYCIGTLLLIISPGNHQRLEAKQSGGPVPMQLVFSLFTIIISLKVTYMLIAILVIGKLQKRLMIMRFYKENAFYWHAFFICLALNLYVGVSSNRQLFGMELVALLLMITALREVRNVTLNKVLLFMTLSLAIWVGYYSLTTCIDVSKDYDVIENKYARSKSGLIYHDCVPLKDRPFVVDPCHHISYNEMFHGGIIQYRQRMNIDSVGKQLKILPVALNKLTDNSYIITKSGDVFIVTKNNRQTKAIIKRTISLYGIKIPFSDYSFVPNDATLYFCDNDVEVHLLLKNPFIEVEEVLIEQS